MRFAIPLLVLLAAGCAAPEPPPTEATSPDAGEGTIITDYGGGTAPVGRYVVLPDGRTVRIATDGAPPSAP
ncbi:hypothetical protein, partial [Neoroseomonas soli]